MPGHPDEAVAILERILHDAPGTHLTKRTSMPWDLAAACLRRPSPKIDQARGLLGEAVTLAHHAGLAENVQRALRVRVAHLSDHVNESVVCSCSTSTPWPSGSRSGPSPTSRPVTTAWQPH
jgi:hypothetical protein